MNMSWLQAWANKTSELFRLFNFETLSHRFVPIPGLRMLDPPGLRSLDPPGLCTLDPPLRPPSTLAEGGRGGPPNFVLPQILFFLWVKTHSKISKPYDKPFWDKSNLVEERETSWAEQSHTSDLQLGWEFKIGPSVAITYKKRLTPN